jgi:hypothetical protein
VCMTCPREVHGKEERPWLRAVATTEGEEGSLPCPSND